MAPVRDRIARRGAGLAGTAGQAFERGSPRRRRPPRYAPNSSTLLYLALGTSTCDTDVPTVGAHLGVGMQVFNTSTLIPCGRGSIHLRQPEMKMFGCERYIEQRKRGQKALSPIVASPYRSWAILRLHQLKPSVDAGVVGNTGSLGIGASLQC